MHNLGARGLLGYLERRVLGGADASTLPGWDEAFQLVKEKSVKILNICVICGLFPHSYYLIFISFFTDLYSPADISSM